MRILVTGGAGFIGSNFVRRTLGGAYPELADAEIVVLDKLTYAGTMDSLRPVIDDPRLRFVHGDICDAPLVRTLLDGVSLIVHFAAETHVDRSIENGDDFVRTNVLGTQTLLSAALHAGTGRFVSVSTDEVYGSISTGSWTEESPLLPNSPYSAAKAAGDLLAAAFARTHGLPVSVTRCSNNYGPFQHPEKIIPLFLTNLMDGAPVTLYGNGSNVREWTHVDDHCAGVALVATGGRPGEVYNIGSPTELANTELTDLLLRAMGADRSAVRHVADRKGHDHRYSLDSGKIEAELGYRPRVPFDQGIRDTVHWYRDNRDWWEPLKKDLPAASRRRDAVDPPRDGSGRAPVRSAPTRDLLAGTVTREQRNRK